MTGQGQARCESDQAQVQVEVRSVNNRFLKVNVRSSEAFSQFNPRIEKALSAKVSRGSVNINIKIESDLFDNTYQLNQPVLKSYKEQIESIFGLESEKTWAGLFQLPGVVKEELNEPEKLEEIWPIVQQAVNDAVDNLNQMRKSEGEAMGADLEKNLSAVLESSQEIQKLAPTVSKAYETRLEERINQLLKPFDVEIQKSDIVKEVGLFADRCDISEELVRLESHIDQFRGLLQSNGSHGRKWTSLLKKCSEKSIPLEAKPTTKKSRNMLSA